MLCGLLFCHQFVITITPVELSTCLVRTKPGEVRAVLCGLVGDSCALKDRSSAAADMFEGQCPEGQWSKPDEARAIIYGLAPNLVSHMGYTTVETCLGILVCA
jgi:hypothetical protein